MKNLAFIVSTQSGFALSQPPMKIMPLLCGKNFTEFEDAVQWLRENGYDAYRILGPREEVIPQESDTSEES